MYVFAKLAILFWNINSHPVIDALHSTFTYCFFVKGCFPTEVSIHRPSSIPLMNFPTISINLSTSQMQQCLDGWRIVWVMVDGYFHLCWCNSDSSDFLLEVFLWLGIFLWTCLSKFSSPSIAFIPQHTHALKIFSGSLNLLSIHWAGNWNIIHLNIVYLLFVFH